MKALPMFAICTLAAAYAAGAQAIPLNTNLLGNPGFEDSSSISGTHWGAFGCAFSSGTVMPTGGPAAQGGSYYVWGKGCSGYSLVQSIDLGAPVTASGLTMEFGVWQYGLPTSSSLNVVKVSMLDATSQTLGSPIQLPSAGGTSWREVTGSAVLLAGTRKIQYELFGFGDSGADDTDYTFLDDAYLKVVTPRTPADVPEPPALLLFGIGLAGIGLGLARRKAARQ